MKKMAELDTVSYDQYRNIPSFEDLNQKVKIVFSSKCMKILGKCLLGQWIIIDNMVDFL